MKRAKKWIILALLCLAVGYVAADIFCDDLKNCSGTAGCIGSGSLSGCTLTCTGGGSITCVTIDVY